MKRILIVIAICWLGLTSIAQENNRNYQIKSALSFAPGLLTEKTKTIQLQGYLAFLQERIEIRGEAFYFLGSSGERPRFDMNHQLFTGVFYHFSDKNFQPYLGFQPGIALTRSSEYSTLDATTGNQVYKTAINPVGSVGTGFDFYGEKLFFLFMETRYIFGQHKNDAYPVYLDEWRFSFGLGLTF